jgi:alpha-N-arabinofuranosidase
VRVNTRNLILSLTISLLSTFSLTQTQTVHTTIDASKTSAPISKYIYGQFLEHIGGIVNNGIWAEMLDDRKFYYPINSHPPPPTRRPKLPADDGATLDAHRRR